MSCRSCEGQVKDLSFDKLVMCMECSLVQLKGETNDTLIQDIIKGGEFRIPYIGSILSQNAFESIGKDSVYFSLKSLEHLLDRHDLAVTYIEPDGIYLKIKIESSDVVKLRKAEKKLRLDNWGTYFLFALKARK